MMHNRKVTIIGVVLLVTLFADFGGKAASGIAAGAAGHTGRNPLPAVGKDRKKTEPGILQPAG